MTNCIVTNNSKRTSSSSSCSFFLPLFYRFSFLCVGEKVKEKSKSKLRVCQEKKKKRRLCQAPKYATSIIVCFLHTEWIYCESCMQHRNERILTLNNGFIQEFFSKQVYRCISLLERVRAGMVTIVWELCPYVMYIPGITICSTVVWRIIRHQVEFLTSFSLFYLCNTSSIIHKRLAYGGKKMPASDRWRHYLF